MSVAEVSGERVEERLASLEETYDSFPVNQTTLTVSTAAYERAREQCAGGLVDAYVQVYNDDEDVLLVEREESWAVPHAKPRGDERLEAGIRRGISDRTGVVCTVTDLERVTILGVRHEDERELSPVYRLVTVFAGEYVGGTPGDAAAWHSELPESVLPTG